MNADPSWLTQNTVQDISDSVPPPQFMVSGTPPPLPPTNTKEQQDASAKFTSDIDAMKVRQQQQADAARADQQAEVAERQKIDQRIDEERNEQKQLRLAEIDDLKGRAAEAQSIQKPQDETGYVFKTAPLFLLMTAFSTGFMRKASTTALASLNGIVQGLQSGSEDAYKKAQDQYDRAMQQLQQGWALRDKIFQQMQGIYGDDLQGLQRSWEIANAAIENDKAMAQKSFNSMDQLVIAEDRLKAADAERRAKAAQAAKGVMLDPAALKLEAELYARDPSNSRLTKEEKAQVMRYLASKGITAEDVVQGRAETKLTYTEARVLGTQKANLERIEQALSQPGGIGDQAAQAAAALSPKQAKLYNQVSQLFAAQVSDPALTNFKVKMIALRDEYATVINKGAAPTEGSRQQANEAMDQFQPTAVPAIVQAIRDVARANREATDTTIEELKRSLGPLGGGPSVQPPAATAAPQTDPNKTGVIQRGPAPPAALLKPNVVTKLRSPVDGSEQRWTLGPNGQPMQVP